MRAFAIMALALSVGACATITRGTTEQLQIMSEPAGAEARTSMGHTCLTPCTIQVARKDELTVTISKVGYEPASVPIATKVAGSGAAGFAGNILLGGVIGMAADASTGAALEHYPNPVMVQLVPIPVVPSLPAVVSRARTGQKLR